MILVLRREDGAPEPAGPGSAGVHAAQGLNPAQGS